MDPLSITASVVTLIATTTATIRYLERVRSFSESTGVLFALINSVTDLQAMLVITRDSIEALQSSPLPAAAEAYKSLPQFVDKTQAHVDDLLDFINTKILKAPGKISFRAWNKQTEAKLAEFKDIITDSYQRLHTVIASANLRILPSLIQAINDVSIIQESHHVDTSHTLEQITSMLALNNTRVASNSCGFPNASTTLPRIMEKPQGEKAQTASSKPTLCVKIALLSERCDALCTCQCHVKRRARTPKWIESALGALFYNSIVTPTMDARPCTSGRCKRSVPSSANQLTYYFPSWAMRTAIYWSTWRDFRGGARWVIEIPREISSSASCWNAIKLGNMQGVRDLLSRRMMSPYDIDPNGWSVLHWAQNCWQIEICELLLNSGASWNFKDRQGRSAADLAWGQILRYGLGNEQCARSSQLLGPHDDNYELKLSPVHRIVLGLSDASLSQHLHFDASAINDIDWLERTPLMWAALRDDCEKVQVLICEQANVSLCDNDGSTDLHMAARRGCSNCIRSLLAAGADPTRSDYFGNIPLHDAAINRNVLEATSIIHILCGLSNLEARNHLGSTPLYYASQDNEPHSVSALLLKGADINTIRHDGSTPIAAAICMNNLDILKILCEGGAKFSWGSRTILEEACRHGSIAAMEIIAATNPTKRIDYDPAALRRVFDVERKPVWATREEELPCESDTLKAFINLLEACGHPVDGPVGYEEENETECIFEDAMEDLAPTFLACGESMA